VELAQYERRVKRLALTQRPFAAIEAEIDAAPVTEEHKAALWLLAWSYQRPRKQRRLAQETLRALQAADG
jgi:hypothetical protein